ncbi:hypothetical protein [Bacillus sp. FJAT-47783]|uniref:DUF6944 family repetitive protein n=1 Tax=Bacillus sp. FJAT-47783 TaxID=2922712 RepID=UPI001FAC5A59|nr:hypothetical protein [Bacillus sp. FJAT-47783]
MEKDSRLLELAGVWTQTAGTAIASIGHTIIIKVESMEAEELATKLVIIGNTLEAVGNSFQAIATSKSNEQQKGQSFSVLGGWLQAGGNSTNAVANAMSLKHDEFDTLRLDLTGDVIQSIGAAFEAVGASVSDSEFAKLKLSGLSLQSAGAAIEAIGILNILNGKEKQGEQIVAFGSYAQTAGATIAAIATTKEFEVELEE